MPMQIAIMMRGNRKNCAMSREVGFFTSISSSTSGTDTLVLLVSIQRTKKNRTEGTSGTRGQVTSSIINLIILNSRCDNSQFSSEEKAQFRCAPSYENWELTNWSDLTRNSPLSEFFDLLLTKAEALQYRPVVLSKLRRRRLGSTGRIRQLDRDAQRLQRTVLRMDQFNHHLAGVHLRIF